MIQWNTWLPNSGVPEALLSLVTHISLLSSGTCKQETTVPSYQTNKN